MTDAEARALEERWGAPGPAPDPDWRCCYRCGQWWPPEPRIWCMPHRLCRACKSDERRGIWPYLKAWHLKNRWGADGRLVRRCCVCRQWRPLAEYYLIGKRDKQRTHQTYAYAACIPCAIARKGHRSLSQMRKELRAA